MEFAAHFIYDREIALWLSSFIAKALPGTCFPEEVAFDLWPAGIKSGVEAYRLSMTLDIDGGQVDIDAAMSIGRHGDPLADSPCFEILEVTRSIEDGRSAHPRTLVWNDLKGVWLELGDPLSGLSVLDGGLV